MTKQDFIQKVAAKEWPVEPRRRQGRRCLHGAPVTDALKAESSVGSFTGFGKFSRAAARRSPYGCQPADGRAGPDRRDHRAEVQRREPAEGSAQELRLHHLKLHGLRLHGLALDGFRRTLQELHWPGAGNGPRTAPSAVRGRDGNQERKQANRDVVTRAAVCGPRAFPARVASRLRDPAHRARVGSLL